MQMETKKLKVYITTGSFGLYAIAIAMGIGAIALVPNASASCVVNLANEISDCDGGNCIVN
ncbi:MAG: hypothetical protein WC876_07455, partial [Candidatus Thermoplasmatota archaeon]